MVEKTLVLVNPEVYGEPLYVEFDEEIHVSNRDQIVCEVTTEQVQKMIEHSEGCYFEDNIVIPSRIKDYLKDLEEERQIWEQVNKTEEVIREIFKNKKGENK